MESPDKKIMIFSALSVISYSIESFIPYPVIFFRIGVGNAFVVSAFYVKGIKGGLTVAFIKLIVGSVFTGRIFTPFFLFSLAGTVLSFLGMSLLYGMKRFISPLGLSATGGVLHNMGQLMVLWLYYGQSVAEQWLLILWYMGLLSGIFTGIVAIYSLKINPEKWLKRKISSTL